MASTSMARDALRQLKVALDRNHDKLHAIFREWDTEKNGSVSKVEFRRAIDKLNIEASKSTVDALLYAPHGREP